MARLKKAKIKRSKAAKNFRYNDTDYLSKKKAKRSYKRPIRQ
jgi:hypothetical protein